MRHPSFTQLGVVSLLMAGWIPRWPATVSVKVHGGGRVLSGAAVFFRCDTSDSTGTAPVITKWTKGPTEIVSGDSERLYFQNDKKELTILYLKKSDEGWYYCHAATKSGDVSNRTYLYIIVPPAITIVRSATVQEGRNATLTCSGSDFFIVHWFFNGLFLTGTRYPRSGKFAQNMTIVQTRRSDSGTYECRAANEKYNRIAWPTVTVQYPPEILQGPEDLHLPPNMEFDARFQCNVTGEPKPVVTWTRDGMNLNYSTDYRLVREKSNGLHTLTIEKAKESDSGMYACEASNGVGKTLARAKLLVGIDDSRLPHVFRSIEYGQSDVLEARAHDLDNPVVEWRKNGETLDYAKNSRLSKTRDGNLNISNAQYEDSGQYVWTATSASLRNEQKITLTVRGPPTAPEIVGVRIKYNKAFVLSTIINWTAPAFDGNIAITGYEVKCRLVGELTWRLMPAGPTQLSVAMDCVKLPGKYQIVVEVINGRGSTSSDSYIFAYDPLPSATPTTDSPSIGGTTTNFTTATTRQPSGSVITPHGSADNVALPVVLSALAVILIIFIAVIMLRRRRRQGNLILDRGVESKDPSAILRDVKQDHSHDSVHVDPKSEHQSSFAKQRLSSLSAQPLLENSYTRQDSSHNCGHAASNTENRSPFAKRRPSTLSTQSLLESSLSTPTPSSQDDHVPFTILVNCKTYSASTSMGSPSQRSSTCDEETIQEVGDVGVDTQVSEENEQEIRDIGLEKQVPQDFEKRDGANSCGVSSRVDSKPVNEAENSALERQVSQVSELSDDEVFNGTKSLVGFIGGCREVKDSGYETEILQASEQDDKLFSGNFGEFFKELDNVEKRMRRLSESEPQSVDSPQGVPVKVD